MTTLTGSMTRRAVIARGGKLAYAVPVIAASFSLAEHRAGAASIAGTCIPFNPVNCRFNTECCGCDTGDACCTNSPGCTTSVNHGPFCVAPGIYHCGSDSYCTTDEQCGTGRLCGATWCGGGTKRICFNVGSCSSQNRTFTMSGVSGGDAFPQQP